MNLISRSVLALCVLLAGCTVPAPVAQPSTGAAAAPPGKSAAAAPTAPVAAPAPIAVQPFDDAILSAANTLFSKAPLPAQPEPYPMVIDPLIDGMTGEQSKASRAMGDRIARLVRERYPNLSVRPFTRESINQSPLILIGTLTPINREGKTEGVREIYRICLALADLKTGKLISKGMTRSDPAGVDTTPTAFFRDSPAWAKERTTDGYVKTCQGSKPGDPMDPIYLDRILIGTIIGEGIDAYNLGRYQDALARYTEAQRLPGGAGELRVLNGLYLTNYKLNHISAATELFGQIVDYGLQNQRLAMKLLFKPGTTAFWPDPVVSGPYEMWLQRIALRTEAASACLEVSGHTSPTGPSAINDRLSQLRAETIRSRLVAIAPALDRRVIAVGVGSRENLIGTGRDDASDALDRRAGFKVISC